MIHIIFCRNAFECLRDTSSHLSFMKGVSVCPVSNTPINQRTPQGNISDLAVLRHHMRGRWGLRGTHATTTSPSHPAWEDTGPSRGQLIAGGRYFCTEVSTYVLHSRTSFECQNQEEESEAYLHWGTGRWGDRVASLSIPLLSWLSTAKFSAVVSYWKRDFEVNFHF